MLQSSMHATRLYGPVYCTWLGGGEVDGAVVLVSASVKGHCHKSVLALEKHFDPE